MIRSKVLKILNPIVAVLFINQVLSGAFAESLPRGAFGIFHKGGAVFLTIVVLVHVSLNGSWIKAQYFKNKPTGKA